MRRFARLDSNQAAIVEALREIGCSVQSLASVGGGCPDVVVGVPPMYGGPRNAMLEIKDGRKKPSARALTPAESKFHAEWRGEVYVVESVEQAIAVVTGRQRAAGE